MPPQAPIRALVVDDSAYNRVTITRMLDSDPRIKVITTAVNGEDAIKQVVRHKPDVITLDLEMPVMDGFAFLRWLMANRPTPVIAVSSRASDRSVFKALELGAFDFITKPGGRVSPRLDQIQRELIEKVLQIPELRIENVRHSVREEPPAAAFEPQPITACAEGVEIVAIGCSTGGPAAIQQVFETLPLLPVPIVIAQHMPPAFTRLFAERVNKLTPYVVKEGVDGEPLVAGHVYVSPGGLQTEVRRSVDGLHLRVMPAGPTDLYAPSVDRLFRSVARACRERTIAVIMTGMGDDGAEAMRELHDAGAKTIAESEETAVIFGMPAAAIKNGAADEVVPLGAIPAAIQRLCSGS